MSDSDDERLQAAMRGDLPPIKRSAPIRNVVSDDSEDEDSKLLRKSKTCGRFNVTKEVTRREPIKRQKVEKSLWETVGT